MTAHLRFRPRVFALEPVPGATELLDALATVSGAVALDSAGGAPARFSLFAFEPLDPELAPLPAEPRGLREALARIERVSGDRLPGRFAGGFVGAFAYDLGVAGEDQALPRDPWEMPGIVGGFYTDYVVLDHERGGAWLVLGDEPGDGRASVAERRERFHARLAAPASLSPAAPAGVLTRHVSADEHRARIETARARIARGDLYQANLAHRFTRAMHGHPLSIYRELRRAHPAPYQAYFGWNERAGAVDERDRCVHWPAGALLSCSPELLLECEGRALRTRPIKGTIARGRTAEEDARARAALLASEKDRAELAMIVDLERNDLGRVARAGSVHVERFPELESYATVHHLVADVRAELAPGRDALDAFCALFPGGSISGAPKLAAMELIGELEGEGRGFFSGSAGFLDLEGRALFDILIRTLVWRPQPSGGGSDGEVSFHVGGGITWSSRAAEEEAETLHKGAALARALECAARGGEDSRGAKPPSKGVRGERSAGRGQSL